MIKMCIAGIFGRYYSHSGQKRDKQKHKKKWSNRQVLHKSTDKSVGRQYVFDQTSGLAMTYLLFPAVSSVKCQSVNLM